MVQNKYPNDHDYLKLYQHTVSIFLIHFQLWYTDLLIPKDLFWIHSILECFKWVITTVSCSMTSSLPKYSLCLSHLYCSKCHDWLERFRHQSWTHSPILVNFKLDKKSNVSTIRDVCSSFLKIFISRLSNCFQLDAENSLWTHDLQFEDS